MYASNLVIDTVSTAYFLKWEGGNSTFEQSREGNVVGHRKDSSEIDKKEIPYSNMNENKN